MSAVSAVDDEIEVLKTPDNNIAEEALSKNVKVIPQNRNYIDYDDDDYDDDYDDDDDDDDYDDYYYYKKTVSKGKIKTKVKADPKTVKYKKNNYFKVKVENKYDDDIAIKNVKLKIKVGKGSDAKTFKVKTNRYGVAKFNTKSLKAGTHKVLITSENKKYKIKKSSQIIVGKHKTATLTSSSKVLKNKDEIGLKIRNDYDDDEKEVKVVFKKKAKFTKITKAKFYLKNKYTGKVIVKTDRVEFDDGKWEMPDEDFSNRYSLLKVKVYYISTK